MYFLAPPSSFQAQGVAVGVEPKMLLPSFLVATSNAMGMASVSQIVVIDINLDVWFYTSCSLALPGW